MYVYQCKVWTGDFMWFPPGCLRRNSSHQTARSMGLAKKCEIRQNIRERVYLHILCNLVFQEAPVLLSGVCLLCIS